MSDGAAHTFLRESEITAARGNKSFDLSPTSNEVYLLGGTRFQGDREILPESCSIVPTDRELFPDERGKTPPCKTAAGVFFYLTLYGGRWLFLNYRSTDESNSPRISSAESFLLETQRPMFRLNERRVTRASCIVISCARFSNFLIRNVAIDFAIVKFLEAPVKDI